MPHLVAIDEDMENLDEGGKDVKRSRKVLLVTHCARGRRHQPVPASLELPPVSAVSAALVGQRSWSSPLVMDGAAIMLGNPERAKVL